MIFSGKPVALLALLAASLAAAFYYHGQYQQAQQQAATAEHQLKRANDAMTALRKRQQQVAALDAKYTMELTDAQNALRALRRDVDAGAKRLRLAATCTPAVRQTAASGMDDAARPELTPDARAAYFRLREQLTETDKALAGLQAWVREQCLN